MLYHSNNLFTRLWESIRTHKVRTFSIALGLILILILSQYGFIQVEVNNDNLKSDSKVKLLNQKTSKAVEGSTTKSTFKKLVRRGTYEVSVFNKSETSFNIKSVGGFLRTAKLSTGLKSENKSEFIGYNPKACVNYNQIIAVSWGCISDASSFTAHRPADGLQPTYNDTGPGVLTGKSSSNQTLNSLGEYDESADKFGGLVQAVFESNKTNYVLLREVGSNQSENQHVVYSLDNSYQIIKRTAIDGLESNKLYKVEELDDGFLVYDTSMTDFLKYKTVESKPSKIEFNSPAKGQIKPKNVEVTGSKIFIQYSDYVKDIDSTDSDGLTNIVVTIDGSSSSSQSFDNTFIDQFSSCGNGFCILSDGTLNVYGITKNKPKFLYQINQVDTVVNVGDVLLVSKPDGTISLSIDEKSGYFGHTNNGLDSCGIVYVHKDYYVDCVIDKYKRRSLLSVDTTKNTDLSISRVVNDITNINNVTGISVYKKNILISPDAGEFTRDPKTGNFGYDPAVQKKSIKSLKDSISKLGFDLSDYDVHIIGDN